MAETGGDGSLDCEVEWAGAAGADRTNGPGMLLDIKPER